MTKLKQLHGLMITTSLIKKCNPLSRLINICANFETEEFKVECGGEAE